MKKTLLFSIIAIILVSSPAGFGQDQKRVRTIGSEKYRTIIKNSTKIDKSAVKDHRDGSITFMETFDQDVLPLGWTSGGSSGECKWGSDATPAFPGYFSPDYSLNYNNGTDYDCGSNWGWVRTSQAPVNGYPFEISFMFYNETECGFNCGFDETWIVIYDPEDNVIFASLVSGLDEWVPKSYLIPNTAGVQWVTIEFYFDTYDDLFNDFAGPFIDDLKVTTSMEIPISPWALGIGIFMIAAFTVLRYRKIF
jgi:hypothetical protein